MLTDDRSIPVSAVETAEEVAFLLRRAEQEVEAAAQATHPAAVKAHYRLSSHYLDLADGMDRPDEQP